MAIYLLLILAGLAGGFLAGLLGIGGGIIYVLFLPYALDHFGIPADYLVRFTIANSLGGIVVASLAANVLNIRNREFHLRESLWISLTGASFSLLILKTIVNTPWYSARFFNILLVFFLIYMLISSLLQIKKETAIPQSNPTAVKLGLTGSMGGIFSALTGLGGGAVVVPLLNLVLKMDIKKAKVISLIMIFLTSLALTVANLFEIVPPDIAKGGPGYIFFPVIIPLTIGVLVGSPAGVLAGRKLSSGTISMIFTIFLIIVLLDKSVQLWRSF